MRHDQHTSHAPAVAGVTIVQDVPVEGLAERYAKLGAVEATQAAAHLQQYAIAAQLPFPGGRSISEVFAWIVERLSQRRQLEDLGEHDVDVDWLSFHVPPGGQASLVMRNAHQGRSGLQLRLLDAGWGSGRAVKLSLAHDYGKRRHCLQLSAQVTVHAAIYEVPSNPPEVSTTVIAVRGTSVVPRNPCMLCGQQATEVDPFLYQPDDDQLIIDLTADDTGVERSYTFELAEEDERELGFSLPIGPANALKAGLRAHRVFDAACEVTYSFVPGHRFAPFRAVGPSPDLPFWAVD